MKFYCWKTLKILFDFNASENSLELDRVLRNAKPICFYATLNCLDNCNLMIDSIMDQRHTKHIQLDMEYDCEEQFILLQLFLGCGPFLLTS